MSNIKCQISNTLNVRTTLTLFLYVLAAHYLTFPIYAQSSTPPPNQVNYRSEASTDVAVGNPPASNVTGPTNNNCNGFYNFTDPSKSNYNGNPKKNFGDQKCEYASNPAKFQDNLLTLIDQQFDPGYKAKWMVIIQGESGYDPNAWAAPVGQQAQLNGSGAWGLVQMGSNEVNNGNSLDRGDTYWQDQLQKYAIPYNNALNAHQGPCGALGNAYCSIDTWCYWATARSFACQKK